MNPTDSANRRLHRKDKGVWLVTTSLILLMIFISHVQAEDPIAARPMIAIETTTVSLGLWPYGSSFSHIFEVTNTGNADLKLEVLSKSCHCTFAFLSNQIVPANRTAAIQVGFDVEQGAAPVGTQEVIATIGTNVADQPRLELKVTAEFVRGFLATPTELDFGKVVRNEPAIVTFDLSHFSDRSIGPLTIAGVFQPDILEILPGNERHLGNRTSIEYTVHLNTSKLWGRYFDVIRVETDSPEIPRLEIPVTAHVIGSFEVRPEQLVFDQGVSGVAQIRQITLEPKVSPALPIVRIESDSPLVDAKLVTTSNSIPQLLEVALNTSMLSGNFEATISLYAEGDQKVAEIPVLVLPARSRGVGK